MSFIRQVLSVTNMNLRSILERSGSSLVIIVGIAGSVAVMVSLLAMAEGLSSTISNTGQDDRVIILRDGSNSELSSGVANENLENSYKSFREKAKEFGLPSNYNLNIFQRVQDMINIRTYESGVGETKSCGSGTAATAYALSLGTNEKEFKFSSKGGDYVIIFENNEILLSTATYELEFEGELSKSDFNE